MTAQGTVRLSLVVGALLAAGVTTGCSAGPASPTPASRCGGAIPASASATEVLRDAQGALDCSGGYTISVSGHNLVLPQWGGVDDGTVRVNAREPGARAVLRRTGDDSYTMLYVNSQTFFERATCGHYARVPGGGSTVLAPFLWTTTNALVSGADAAIQSQAGTTVTVAVTLAYLGQVTLEVDKATARPLKLVKSRDPGSGSTSTWTFGAWGEEPHVVAPVSKGDQGPGGNPC